jgi:PAS domain S-box-containing protein
VANAEDLGQQVVALRRCARDLAALSSLPAIWFRADFETGLQNLADVLAAALRAPLVYVRIARSDGRIGEATATDSLRTRPGGAAEIGRELTKVMDFDTLEHPPIVNSLGGYGPLRLAVSQIAAEGRIRGFIVAGGTLNDFPNHCDKLLLATGAAQIAILVQRSDIETEVTHRSALLDESNRQLREANLALLETKKRLDSTLSAAEIGTWTWDLTSNRVIADQNLASLFGLTEAEARGTAVESYFERIHPEDRAQVHSLVQEAIETGGDFSAEYRVNTGPEGHVRWLVARGRVEYDTTGRATSFPGVVLDITERKTAENELRLTRDAAESANRAKDRFLAVLSHELRTPLSPILTTVAALEEQRDIPERIRSDLALIRRNVELETQLIDDLLDVSRIASGKLRLQLEAAHVHEILSHALETCRGEIVAKGLRVEQSLLATNDLVIGDRARLQQVFWNLLRNAAKFTPSSGRILLRTFNPTADLVAVEVEDSGIGIPAEVLPRVFSPFEQGETNVTRQFGGLGLGLAICKAVMDVHGGVIRARSAGPGTGATFEVVFNTTSATLQRGATQPARSRHDDKPTRTRVLIVEDHADTAKSLAWLLTRWGYEVTTAHTAASALEAAAQESFDLIASDIGLPDMDGYELMRLIRERHGLIGIALSGFGMEEDVARAHAAGFAEHIVKPVNIGRLKATLQRLLEAQAAPSLTT